MAVFVSQVAVAPPGAPQPAAAPPSYGGMTIRSTRGSVFLRGDAEALQGWEGLGPAQRRANYSRPLGRDGSIRNRLRPYQISERSISGPIHVEGATPDARARLMDKIIDVCTPLDGSEVQLDINRRGTVYTCSGDALFDGGSEFMAQAAYDRVAVVQFAMTCPDPQFYAPETLTRQGLVAPVAFFPIGPVKLGDSNTFGQPLRIATGGGVQAYPRIEWTGPGTRLTYTASDGRFWRVTLTAVPLLGGQTVTIRTDPASGLLGQYRVEGPSGQSYWQYVSGRSWVPLEPEQDTVRIDVDGAVAGVTEVRIYHRPAVQAIS